MNRGAQLRYDMWLKDVQRLANKCNVSLNRLIAILDEIESCKTLLSCVKADEFINFYLCRTDDD